MRAGEPHPPDAVYPPRRPQQVGEQRPGPAIGGPGLSAPPSVVAGGPGLPVAIAVDAPPARQGQVAAVAVDVLAQQGDLADAACGQVPHLVDQFTEGAADLGASHRGNDAEGATVVASDPDRLGQDLHDRSMLPGVVDQLGGTVHVVGAEHDIDVAGPLPDQFPVLLGQAPGHCDERAGPLCLHGLEPAQSAVQLVVGVLADAAGVEHHHVGILQDGGALVPVALEQARDPLGVVLVHLAPEGADGIGPPHTHRLRCGSLGHLYRRTGCLPALSPVGNPSLDCTYGRT